MGVQLRNQSIALLVGCTVFAFVPRMLTSESINAVLLWLCILLVVAIGETLVILTGGIDISVGSTLAFSGMSVGLILEKQPTLPIPLCFMIGSIVGLILGLINGLLIARARLSPLIVTIGTLASYRGATFLIGSGKTITSSTLPDALIDLTKNGLSFQGISLNALLLISIALIIATHIFLKHSPFGRTLFAVGSQPTAAFRRGISESNVQLFAYSAAGAFAGLAGVMYLSRFASLNPGTAGNGYELTVIAATVLGGTKLSGGRASMLGLIASCLFLSLFNVALSLLGIPADFQLFVYGFVLIIALALDRLRGNK